MCNDISKVLVVSDSITFVLLAIGSPRSFFNHFSITPFTKNKKDTLLSLSNEPSEKDENQSLLTFEHILINCLFASFEIGLSDVQLVFPLKEMILLSFYL
ncbi:hypothetical protein [Lysinibacillus xylanilyticus]|uniref:hypothetical protein n=1 Tax=Lysinibacillus xylanilyticus TaxID=582475 RepID=UPI0036DBF0C7